MSRLSAAVHVAAATFFVVISTVSSSSPTASAGGPETAVFNGEKKPAQRLGELMKVMEVEMDHFLEEQELEKKERQKRGRSSLDDTAALVRANAQATSLIKNTKKNVEGLEATLKRLASALREDSMDESTQVKELEKVKQQNDELTQELEEDSRVQELEKENAQLKADKESLVKSVSTLLHQAKASKMTAAIKEANHGAEQREAAITKSYAARVQSLEEEIKDLNKKNAALETQTEDAQELLRRNQGKAEDDKKDVESMKGTVQNLQEENDSLIKDKGSLMKSLRTLLKQNTQLRKQATAAKAAAATATTAA